MTSGIECEPKLMGVDCHTYVPHRASKQAWCVVVILGFWLLALHAKAASRNMQDSAQQSASWLQEHLLKSESNPPFSFVYGRKTSEALLKGWARTTSTRQLDNDQTER